MSEKVKLERQLQRQNRAWKLLQRVADQYAQKDAAKEARRQQKILERAARENTQQEKTLKKMRGEEQRRVCAQRFAEQEAVEISEKKKLLIKERDRLNAYLATLPPRTVRRYEHKRLVYAFFLEGGWLRLLVAIITALATEDPLVAAATAERRKKKAEAREKRKWEACELHGGIVSAQAEQKAARKAEKEERRREREGEKISERSQRYMDSLHHG